MDLSYMSYFLINIIKQQILFLMIAFFAVFLSRIVNNDLSFAFNIQNSLLYSFIQYFISVLIVFSAFFQSTPNGGLDSI